MRQDQVSDIETDPVGALVRWQQQWNPVGVDASAIAEEAQRQGCSTDDLRSFARAVISWEAVPNGYPNTPGLRPETLHVAPRTSYQLVTGVHPHDLGPDLAERVPDAPGRRVNADDYATWSVGGGPIVGAWRGHSVHLADWVGDYDEDGQEVYTSWVVVMHGHDDMSAPLWQPRAPTVVPPGPYGVAE
jgi:hypothetical protein